MRKKPKDLSTGTLVAVAVGAPALSWYLEVPNANFATLFAPFNVGLVCALVGWAAFKKPKLGFVVGAGGTLAVQGFQAKVLGR